MLLANHCRKENLNFGSTTLRPLYKPAKSQQSSPKPSLPCEPHLKLPRDADNLGLGDWGGGLGEEGTLGWGETEHSYRAQNTGGTAGNAPERGSLLESYHLTDRWP